MKIGLYAAVIALALLMCGCGDTTGSTGAANHEGSESPWPQAEYEPLTFSSFEALNKAREASSPLYYASELENLDFYYALSPELLEETDAVLEEIRIKSLYLAQEFYFGEPTELSADMTWDARYSAELSNRLMLEWTRVGENVEQRFAKDIEKLGMRPLDEKEFYYYRDITSDDYSAELRSLYWMEDGYCFYMEISKDVYDGLTGGDTSYETISRITKLERVELPSSGLTVETEP